MPIVHEFFAEVDNPQTLFQECSESNIHEVDVERKKFRLNGLKRGTRRRKGESVASYRSRRVFSDMVSYGLRYVNEFHGLLDDDMIASFVGLHTEQINAEIGRDVTREVQRHECRRAVAEARRLWNPETARKIRSTASKAGSVTKWTLEDFLETRDMTVTQALRHLRESKGIRSRTTIYQMRKHYEGFGPRDGRGHMIDNNWPATMRQRSYGMSLEDQLGEPESDWSHMTVTEASQRIEELLTMREFAQIVNGL